MNENIANILSELSQRLDAHSGEVILRDIDHGYKSQFSLVPMSAAEFEM
jgi:hypothetical protein